ncbi:MAG: EscU/YscU/HrcU family type III secretion system export apparatus switch protein [Opitutales bacterium]
MAEDQDMKTEEPTAKKRSEEFAKGNLPKAQEIGIVATLITAFMYILFKAREQAILLSDFASNIFGRLGDTPLTLETAIIELQKTVEVVAVVVGPFATYCVVAAVLANGMQTRFKLTTKAIEPSITKFNPISGFKRIFGKEVLVNFGIDFLKFVGVGSVLYGLIDTILADPIFYTPVPIGHVGTFIAQTFMDMFAYLIALMIIIAFLNYLYQKHKVHEGMKMTKQEVKDETKSAQGDADIKGRQKQFMRKVLQQSMLRKVNTADLVVTNPTHYAIALRYIRGRDAAPMVIAKGKGQFAKRIKAEAKKHGVPMVENRPVARMLFSIGQVDAPIPAELYTVVAEILGYVYKTHKYYFHELKRRRQAEGLI